MIRSLALLTGIFVLCLLAGTALAQSVHNVSSIAQLQTAINRAVPGDQIILKNGSYTTTGAITVARAGVAGKPITIAAQTIRGATIKGAGGFHLTGAAAFVTIQGFVLLHSGTMVMDNSTHNCLVTRNVFQLPSGTYLNLAGNDQEVSFNTFQNKTNAGQFINFTDGHNTMRAFIHHNYFHNHSFTGGNGGDAIQVFGVLSRIESNLFEATNGDPESISVKEGGASPGGFYRFNTFRNITRGQLTLRFTRNDLVEGNFFINSAGIRAYGSGHVMRNNYFENGQGITVGDGASDGTYPVIDGMEISFNTFINSRITGEHSTKHDLTPQRVTFANNIMQAATGTLVAEPDPWLSSTYEGNIFFGAAAPGAIPPSGFRTANPMLAADASGIFHIQASSPAINTSAGVFSITTDMDGQRRDPATDGKPPDVGADEFSTAPITHKALTAADVGPNAH